MSILGNNLLAQYYAQQGLPEPSLYLPLSSQNSVSEEGYTMTKSNESGVSFVTENGISCMRNTSCLLRIGTAPFGGNFASFTMSCWCKLDENGKIVLGGFPPNGTGGSSLSAYSNIEKDNTFAFLRGGNNAYAQVNISSWHNYVLEAVYGEYVSFFMDGNKMAQVTSVLIPDVRQFLFYSLNGYCASYRLYKNKILSQSQIKQLAHEFLPTL